MRALTLCARADLEVDRVALRPIDEMMTVSDPSLETRGVARLQHGRSTIVDQRDLALEHVNELVFGLVPVAQRGGGAGLEARDVHAKLGQASRIADPLLFASRDHGSEFFRIGRDLLRRNSFDLDLWHLLRNPR